MNFHNFFGHLSTVNKHRWTVFKLSIKAGVPFRGLIHDLSKYSPDEFFEGVKYYNGKMSPINVCKKETGYSKAWLHHKGRNKHHFEYWYDHNARDSKPLIPYKYFAEIVCDTLAAGITYQGKNWNIHEPIKYFETKQDKSIINEKMILMLKEVYLQIEKDGIDKTINGKNLKEIYTRYKGEL